LKAYAQYQDRLAGTSRPEINRASKIEKVKAEINHCLKTLGDASSPALKTFLVRALELFNSTSLDEEQLEQIDEEVDNFLWENSSAEDRKSYLEEARKDYPGRTAQQLEEIQRLLLIKGRRQALKIPYVSLFYH